MLRNSPAPVVAAAFVIATLLTSATAASAAEKPFPDWSFNLKLWPFDILYPTTTTDEILDRLDDAVAADADSTIVYIEEEHMYGSFVDEAGFTQILALLEFLVEEAQVRGLRVIVYLNGLEVMTHGAFDPVSCAENSGPSMAREHPEWLQQDLEGEAIVYSCLDLDWVTPDMEDAWVSPFSPYRQLFQDRLIDLGEIGVHGVYIDATFLPGLQPDEENLRWGTTDAAAADYFTNRTGFAVPTTDDWQDPAWRAWLVWRHEVVRDYLATLAATAWQAGMVPFWESSSNDTPEGTLLGNETAITAENSMGFSPEIEPEGDWLAAFRMMQAARDLALQQPLIYLGWPLSEGDAALELAIALAFSNTLYPTADAPYPVQPFAFADQIRDQVLNRRRGHVPAVALVYSVRNKDWSYPEGTHFDAYDDAFRDLARAHIPFRIVVLEHLDEQVLAPFDVVVVPGVASISDSEHALLSAKSTVLIDEVGTRDETWTERDSALIWPNRLEADLDDLATALPFEVAAPESTWISYYDDGAHGFFLFAVHSARGGELRISAAEALDVTLWRPGQAAQDLAGSDLGFAISSEISVIQVAGNADSRGPRRVSGRHGPQGP